MINLTKKQLRWGPIPGRVISVIFWRSIFRRAPKRLHNFLWPECYVLYKDQKMLFICELGVLLQVGGQVFQQLVLTRKREKIWRAWEKSIKNLFSFCQNVTQNYLRRLTDQELESDWKQLTKLIEAFWIPAVIPELGAYGGEPILDNALRQENLSPSEILEALATLTTPEKPSFYQEEEQDRLELLKYYQKPEFEEKLKSHQQKYYWIENSYYQTRVLNLKYFKEQAQEKLKECPNPDQCLRKINGDFKRLKKLKEKILQKIKNQKIKDLAEGLAFCIWWQDQRKKYVFKFLHYVDLFVREFSTRSGVSTKHLDYAVPEEISAKVSDNLKKELKQRWENPFVINELPKKDIFYYGRQAQILHQKLWEIKINSKGGLKGIVASYVKEKIQGRVFVIRKPADVEKFPQDYILVTTMTAPEYITAIRKARAIVTDAGGITSHAAIVSRELKIPCLVGTKIATKFLKNGDKIEVDATKGIVQKLK